MKQTPELTGDVIPAEEAAEIMKDDIVVLLSKDIRCPLAKAIEEAIRLIDIDIRGRKPDLGPTTT